MNQVYHYANQYGSITICSVMFFGDHWRINEQVDIYSITEYPEYITFTVDTFTYIYIKHCGIARVQLTDLVRDIISYNNVLYLLSPYGFFYMYNTDGHHTYNINIPKKQYVESLVYLVNYVQKNDAQYNPRLLDCGRKVFVRPYDGPRGKYSKKLCDITITTCL